MKAKQEKIWLSSHAPTEIKKSQVTTQKRHSFIRRFRSDLGR